MEYCYGERNVIYFLLDMHATWMVERTVLGWLIELLILYIKQWSFIYFSYGFVRWYIGHHSHMILIHIVDQLHLNKPNIIKTQFKHLTDVSLKKACCNTSKVFPLAIERKGANQPHLQKLFSISSNAEPSELLHPKISVWLRHVLPILPSITSPYVHIYRCLYKVYLYDSTTCTHWKSMLTGLTK